MNSIKSGLLTMGGRIARNVLFAAVTIMVIVQTGFAETLEPADAEALEARAKAVCDVFRKKNPDALIEMTHPAVFDVVESKEKLVEVTKVAMSRIDEMKITILEDNLGTPSEVYASKDQMVCFYPRTMVMQIGDKKVKGSGFLICARKRDGGKWLFIDGEIVERDPAMLEKLLPGLPKDVQLPESKSEPIE